MYISRIRLRNYKSFLDSGDIAFSAGMNVIIGPNNSGKTALLEAISLKTLNRPTQEHPERQGHSKSHFSQIDVTVTVPGEEFRRYAERHRSIIIPTPQTGPIQAAVKSFNESLENSLRLSTTFTISEMGTVTFGLYEEKGSSYTDSFTALNWNNEEFEPLSKFMGGYREADTLGRKLLEPLVDNIYRFYAERVNVARCLIGNSSQLNRDASNLAEVLQVLQTKNPYKFEKFINLVTELFPEVKWISAETGDDDGTPNPRMVELKVWTFDKSTERHDLAIPLSECGTGIGQGLAMLYVLISSEDKSRTLIIDEPQSFLHPGAAKKLMQILSRYPDHQYFISTHSPEILAAANPSTITGLNLRDGVSVAKGLSKDQTGELRKLFRRIGISFGDVFYADSILWVEGPTEEIAFPMILKEFASGTEASGISVQPLVNTGDVQSKKHARLVLNIYKKLSGAHALAPPIVSVILDSETLKSGEIKEFDTLSSGLVAFLPRRCFENYLLDADAIAAVANEQENFRTPRLESSEVAAWLDKQRKAKRYLPEETKNLELNTWLEMVDGARLLARLFSHFSETRVSYIKTVHSIELTEWLLANKPEQLRGLGEFILARLRMHEEEEGPNNATA